MTSGEMKFALRVESVLNTVPEPEFRQLLVETLILLAMVVENRVVPLLDDVIQVAKIVKEANRIFLKDQVTSFPRLIFFLFFGQRLYFSFQHKNNAY
jgi:phosphorylase kinase alpha/beta subunit